MLAQTEPEADSVLHRWTDETVNTDDKFKIPLAEATKPEIITPASPPPQSNLKLDIQD